MAVQRPGPAGGTDLPRSRTGGAGREKIGAGADGKPAQTLYQVVQARKAAGAAVSWLVLMPLTGRTHQLRAHCAALGVPILCDGKYGGRAAFPPGLVFGGRAFRDAGGSAGGGADGIPKRLMLLAREIAVPHPEHDATLRVQAPLPAHMEAAFAALGFRAARGERAAGDLIGYAEGLAHSPPGARPGPKKDREHRTAAGKSTAGRKKKS